MTTIELRIEPLTAEAFAPFGEVLELGLTPTFRLPTKEIRRFSFAADTPAMFQILSYKAQDMLVPRVEQHLHVTESRFHVAGSPAVVVMAPPSPTPPRPEDLRAFLFDRQGALFFKGTWHALDAFPLGGPSSDFLFLSDRETQRELFDEPVPEPKCTLMHSYRDEGLEIRVRQP